MTDLFTGIDVTNRRVFKVSRTALWEAFADPAALASWWGPQGFRNEVTAFDLRPGGAFAITMISPNGVGFDNHKTFHEVAPNERVVFEHHRPVHHFLMSMAFEDAGAGESRLTWRMRFTPASDQENLDRFIHAANEQNFDRLEAFFEYVRETS